MNADRIKTYLDRISHINNDNWEEHKPLLESVLKEATLELIDIIVVDDPIKPLVPPEGSNRRLGRAAQCKHKNLKKAISVFIHTGLPLLITLIYKENLYTKESLKHRLFCYVTPRGIDAPFWSFNLTFFIMNRPKIEEPQENPYHWETDTKECDKLYNELSPEAKRALMIDSVSDFVTKDEITEMLKEIDTV
jgi:hypothetical protein